MYSRKTQRPKTPQSSKKSTLNLAKSRNKTTRKKKDISMTEVRP